MDAAGPAPEIACARCRELEARVLELETRLRDLEDKLKPPKAKPHESLPPAPAKTPTGKKRGGQPGHPPHLKKWLPQERVTTVLPYSPEWCARCERSLAAIPNDPSPTIHQVAELPKILAEIAEHRGHSRTCPCGHVTHAAIPAEVRAHTLGPNLTASLVYLSGVHGMSKRGIEETVERLFGVPVALGTIANVEREVGAALEAEYRKVRAHVADAPVKNLDETGWKQAGKKRWLWVATTANAVLFLIHPRRNLDALKMLLGKLAGIVVSDRWCVYDEWDFDHRQLCWAHVGRNWEKLIERGGKAKELGERWLATQKDVFELWHLFRGGGCSRSELGDRLEPHVEELGELLHAGMRSRDGVLSRRCGRLLDRYPLLWLFASVEGVEPTNNHGERVQRRAVLWRRRSFGCASASGCRYVERILTAVETLRLQKRNVLEFLGETVAAAREGRPGPSLCPAAG
jgi:transposase